MLYRKTSLCVWKQQSSRYSTNTTDMKRHTADTYTSPSEYIQKSGEENKDAERSFNIHGDRQYT